MTSWWCAGGEPYTACGLFEGHVDANAPASPSKTTHIELEFVELPKRDGEVEVEMQDMGQSWMQPPSQLPYATSTEGVGGRLKAKPEHFRVTELLRSAPDGKKDRGDACHYVLRIRRQNRTTEWVRRRLQEAFGLSSYRDVGVCGQKDKRAVIVQHFSVPSFSPKFERNVPLGECKMLAPCRGDLEVLEVMVSSTKLRRGSHRSNAFQVVLSGVDRDALEACELTLKRLQFTGVPNYFGPQRFVWMRRPSFDGAMASS
uniref:TRUD domain-containing protein n=1 Tax=Pelagomonas calceolata TaxID=35677 RepID=A0A7S4E532_9STRA